MLPNRDYTNTSSRSARRRATAAFTLVELSVAMAVALIFTVALVSFVVYTSRSFAGIYNYMELEGQSRTALDRMTKEIRQTQGVTAFSSNTVEFLDVSSNRFSYVWSPANQTLSRVENGREEVLLTGCEFLRFGLFLRNMTNGTFDQYPVASSPTNAKVVQVSWLCSRDITGTRMNTESVQTAKIVIRQK